MYHSWVSNNEYCYKIIKKSGYETLHNLEHSLIFYAMSILVSSEGHRNYIVIIGVGLIDDIVGAIYIGLCGLF